MTFIIPIFTSIAFQLKRVASQPSSASAATTSPGASPLPATPPAMPLMSGSIPIADKALGALIELLDVFLFAVFPPGPPPPGSPPNLPEPAFSVVSVTEKTVGLGNRRGTDTLGPFGFFALKGLRLEAVVRYQFWGGQPGEVEALIVGLHDRLRVARDQLRAAGILEISAEGTSLAENFPDLTFWRQTADYRVLFEYQYKDNDGADSLIARIPISINSEHNESMVITDHMVRWDDQGTELLEAQGRGTIPFRAGTVFIVAFLPGGWAGEGVTVSASIGGVAHQAIFSSVQEFLDAFTLFRDPVSNDPIKALLGSHEYVVGQMEPASLGFPDPTMLSGGSDFFRISYDAPVQKFDSDAVVYLRVSS